MKRQHILLTGLGVRASETQYHLNGVPATAVLTPLALIQLLSPESRPDRVLALVTQGTRQPQGTAESGQDNPPTWDLFAKGVRSTLQIEAEPIDIPDGCDQNEIKQIIERAAAPFADEFDLTLDVTQGLRHFPFVLYALALYLTSLRGVRLRGVYYGMLEGFPPGSKEPRPIIDLQPLLELPEWFYAVRVFRDTGSTGPLAHLLLPLASELRSEAQSGGNAPELCQTASFAERLQKQLQQVTFAYESAMPLELGKAATLLSKSLNELPTQISNRLPLSEPLAGVLASALEPLKFSTPPTWKGEWKLRTHNDQIELARQASLIDLYLEREQYPLAFGLMSEWVVSFLMRAPEEQKQWLYFKSVTGFNRRSAASRLGALAKAVEDEEDLVTKLSTDQQEWGNFWNQLTTLRNTLHHHGMRQQAMEAAPPVAGDVQAFWDRIKTQNIEMPALGGGKGTLLISAIGNRPGVLYSALLTNPPDRVMILCSEQSESMIDEAARQASFAGPMRRIIVNDAYGGFDEMPRVRAEAGEWLLHADEIVANLTGGTTLMGLMVQQLVEAGGRLSRPYRRFALIDRRPADEQDRAAWVQSAHCWIDTQRGENRAED